MALTETEPLWQPLATIEQVWLQYLIAFIILALQRDFTDTLYLLIHFMLIFCKILLLFSFLGHFCRLHLSSVWKKPKKNSKPL